MREIRVVRTSSDIAVGQESFNYIVLADDDLTVTLLSPPAVDDRYIAIRNTGEGYVSVIATGKNINDSTDSLVISPSTGLVFLVDDTGNFYTFDPFTVGSQITDYDGGTGSYQSLPIDLNLASAVGSSTDPKYIAAIMANLLGEDLTKTKPYLASIIGKLSITGARATSYPLAAIAAEVGDGVSAADGAYVAVLGGDSEQTNARAAYTVDDENTTPGSGFDYIFDATNGSATGHDGYGAVTPLKAVMRLGFDGVAKSIIFAVGVATNDAGIVAQVGADSNYADGSIYLSCVAGAGKFYQKKNDVWTEIS